MNSFHYFISHQPNEVSPYKPLCSQTTLCRVLYVLGAFECLCHKKLLPKRPECELLVLLLLLTCHSLEGHLQQRWLSCHLKLRLQLHLASLVLVSLPNHWPHPPHCKYRYTCIVTFKLCPCTNFLSEERIPRDFRKVLNPRSKDYKILLRANSY